MPRHQSLLVLVPVCRVLVGLDTCPPWFTRGSGVLPYWNGTRPSAAVAAFQLLLEKSQKRSEHRRAPAEHTEVDFDRRLDPESEPIPRSVIRLPHDHYNPVHTHATGEDNNQPNGEDEKKEYTLRSGESQAENGRQRQDENNQIGNHCGGSLGSAKKMTVLAAK